MKVQLKRGERIVLLKWLKQGYIDTDDMPEVYDPMQFFNNYILPLFTDEETDALIERLEAQGESDGEEE